jgi:membrane associated rhomboid family serine protease
MVDKRSARDAFALWPLGPVGCADCHPFEPWQLVTYAFLHSQLTIWHLAGNMFALLIFGPASSGCSGRSASRCIILPAWSAPR